MATIKDVAKAVFHENDNVKGFTIGRCEAVIALAFETIKDTVSNGEKVKVNGFGTFTQAEKAARTGRNPATGDPVDIPPRNVLHFKEQKQCLPQPEVETKKKKKK